jgi:hypothetical protein
MKAAVVAGRRGRTLWADALRPGRMRDATAVRNEAVDACFQRFPDVEVLLDDGYLGLSRHHRGQAHRPENHGREHCPAESSDGNATGTNTPPTASPSNTPSPTTSPGGN